jgi:tetratricopeptide (TPR) repeat protein
MNPERLFLAGLSAYVRGERRAAAQYCARGLEDCGPGDVLGVRLIHLYLTATELWWSIAPTDNVGALVARARAAAVRAGDPALAAMASCLLGRYLIATDALPTAVTAFAEAAELAAESGNLLVKIETLSDLGHHTVGRNLARGMAILRSAQALADESADDGAPSFDRPLLPLQRARLAGLIGVAIFDDGRFDEAESWLRRSVGTLQALRGWDVSASISNYLAQLLTEAGRFEEAEQVLLAALEPLQADADLSTFQGYNLGLLGKLYLEWGRVTDAELNLTAGWARLQNTHHQAVLPILRNYIGELLMHPEYSGYDIGRARELFDETVTECQRSGFQRSEINALTLRALADLRLGDHDGACAASAQAVARLAATGTMPALRSEEVYLVRYQALAAAGANAEAGEALSAARSIIDRKAATIASPRDREQFLTRVQVSRQVMTAGRSS